VEGDFGKSTRFKIQVSEVIGERLPNTILLGLSAIFITYILAFFMGSYAGRKPYTLMDNLIGGLNYIGLAIPSFIAGVFAIFFFSFKLGWFPSNGSVDIGVTDGTFVWWLSRFHYVFLPAVVLGLLSTASYTQFLRNDIIENSRKDYVRTARAKGTPERKIYNVHILRNSIIPLITFLGFDIVAIISGAIIYVSWSWTIISSICWDKRLSSSDDIDHVIFILNTDWQLSSRCSIWCSRSTN
jgi:peptide/nickel transport system permease protein